MEAIERTETVELEADRFIMLEFGRRWPRYVVEWSVRQRVGDSDFPLANGMVDRLPSAGREPDDVWEQMREKALRQASEAAESYSGPPAPQQKRHSFLGRLFGRH
jgi:hypothetical protein